ncbi:MAG: MBL fold metallo-hydrolase [Gemmatimonadetes bacterium]|nr:MBL fold metallo-hydrolase [Gemmatimonadota bacterium]
MTAAFLLAFRLAVPQDSAVLLVRVLDVTDARIGGDAILITDSSQGRARHVLLDGSDRGGTVTRWLASFGVDTLAAVILSHAHADHYGGLDEVLREIPARAFIYAGTPRTAVTYRALLGQVDALAIPVITVDSGVRMVTIATRGDSFQLQLIAPPPTCRALRSRAGSAINNCSLGVRLVRDSFAMLFPGDAQEEELGWWLDAYRSLLPAPVLKAGHHGSANAMTDAWLDAVRPEAVVISANGRQHPFAEVLELLAVRRTPAYCTADHGTVTVRVPRGGGWAVTTERAGRCRVRRG